MRHLTLQPTDMHTQKRSRGRKAGIREVAEQLSLSSCTISRILNNTMGKAKYRTETIELVRRTAQEMGYRPDMIARTLAGGKARMIGLCLADIANPMFAEFASFFERNANTAGYNTIICNTGEDPAVEQQYIQMLMSRRIDAVVISPVDQEIRPVLEHAVKAGCNVVVFDRDIRGSRFHRVQVDGRAGMAELTRRCLALGHRRIGVLAGNHRDGSLQLRLAGIRDAVLECGLDPAESLSIAASAKATTVEAGMRGMEEIVSRSSPPTLVLALANVLSIGGLTKARELGIRIGDELSFAGFDDFTWAGLMRPPITVVTQPIRKMAMACMRLASLEGGQRGERQCFSANLCWRESVRNLS